MSVVRLNRQAETMVTTAQQDNTVLQLTILFYWLGQFRTGIAARAETLV